jgi:hypothetical protein
MKKMSDKEAAAARQRFREHRKAYHQIKTDLINAAHVAENRNAIPEPLLPDVSLEAWSHRMSAASHLLEKRGGFSSDVATLALTDPDWETKEAVASWLRRELEILRKAEEKTGTAPVRRKAALSRTAISDVAIELLEGIAGEALICLFQELLDVDRHRKSLAENFVSLNSAAELEAHFQLQGLDLGVRELANRMSVSPSSVTRWRKNPAFHDRVASKKRVWGRFLRDKYFDEIRRETTGLSEAECFRRAFRLYALSLPEEGEH